MDRGPHGLHVLLLLLAWKLALPHRVFLLRGNHESGYCKGEDAGGFDWELRLKLGRALGAVSTLQLHVL